MSNLLERIKVAPPLPVLGDGAMGTMLVAHGMQAGECPEAICLNRPEILRQIADEYANAGSDIVSTNSFGGNSLRLSHYKLDTRMAEINRAAITVVREAVNGRAMVAASCGPCGGLLEPLGELTEDQVYESFVRQFKVIVETGVDAIFIETMTDLNEATIAIRAAKSVAPSIPVSATMTFDSTPRGFFTVMGVDIKQAAHGLAEAGADLIGSNCGNGLDNMTAIAKEFKKHTTLPLIIQSNAGLPQNVDGKLVYSETPEKMAVHCRELIDIGVSVIGGCCGTTPEHIKTMRSVIDLSV